MKNKPRIDIDWAIEGLRYALDRGNIVVIVDTLRFSTATVTAVNNGFTIYPVSTRQSGMKLARKLGAHLAGRPGRSKYSISPHCYIKNRSDPNKEVVLFSPNGATCSESVKAGQIALIGCLLNARAIADYLYRICHELRKDATVIAAGEQRAFKTGNRITYDLKAGYRVFAIEDYLGAGAIIDQCRLSRTTEAQLCARAFSSVRSRLIFFLKSSFSGRYLVEHHLQKDIEHATKLNLYNVLPVVRARRIESINRS
ncbi:hypothetical protein A2Y85_05890 [candidate division WOR-3 bacterium RBG_13_43_14]|uniref:Probable 2-phosphosulfolactate phosphatase n=1 Tax=candidate division WOR-3 bacterium RBG_13_43_14 TaxID=1802590 RepID=A0A1F4U949_UNCW3|nr:MAG: hypothetical protein A2Y85_05890 [candidate division WOR-3 bacterium RBG_13_43_14]